MKKMAIVLMFLVGCTAEQNTMSFRTASATYRTVAGALAQNVEQMTDTEKEVIGTADVAAYSALEMWYNALLSNDDEAESKAISDFTKAMFKLKKFLKEMDDGK